MEIKIENLDDLILLKIFDYLPIKSLCSAKQVCKKWHLLIDELVKNRKLYPQTILFKSSKFNENNKINLNDFKHDLNLELNYLNYVPKLALFFFNKPACLNFIYEDNIESNELHNLHKRPKLISKKVVSLTSHLNNQLPNENIQKLYIYNDGIIGTNLKLNKTFEIESDYENASFSGLFLPTSDNYRFDVKEFNTNNSKLPDLSTEDDLNSFLNIKNLNESLKFIFILFDGKCKIKLGAFLKSLNKIRNEKLAKNSTNSFACSGGIVEDLYNDSNKKCKLILISLIAKNDYVKIAQIVLPHTPIEQFHNLWSDKINVLKSTGVFTDSLNDNNNKIKNEYKYLTFQVSCCGRGKEYHQDKENYESSLFLKEFKNMPLIGFFGYGEIGVDHLPDYNQTIDQIKHNEYLIDKIMNCCYTTIFTLISFKI